MALPFVGTKPTDYNQRSAEYKHASLDHARLPYTPLLPPMLRTRANASEKGGKNLINEQLLNNLCLGENCFQLCQTRVGLWLEMYLFTSLLYKYFYLMQLIIFIKVY